MNDSFFQLPDNKRNAIINAGFRVFSQYTYKKSPMSEIATEAGISKSLLFYYFRNKKELYLYLCRYSVEVTLQALIEQNCYDNEDFFVVFLSGLKVKVQLMKKYPELSAFQLKAYYEKDEELRPGINKLIGQHSGFGNQADSLGLKKEKFADGFNLELMYKDMYYASEGYLWEKLQGNDIDPDKMEKDFVRMIGFWRKLYSARITRSDDMFNAENNTLKLPCGADMYYARFGKSSKNLVMIPGLNVVDMKGTAGNLAYYYRKFAKEFTVYIFDRRSGRDENATIRSMADDLYDAINSLKIGEAYVLGVSQGGMIAQYLAAEHPQLVKKLVLGVTASETNPTMIKVIDEWIEMAENGDLKGVITKTYDKMYNQKQMKYYRLIIPVLMKFTKFMSVERFADHARAIYSLDSAPLLDRISFPTLVIGAENDMITTAEASKEIAGKLGCKCHIFPDEGHAAYLNNAFNKMVYDFFLQS